MTVLNFPPNSSERLAENGQAAFITGETIGFRESELPARDTADLSRIALDLAHTSVVNPEDFDTSRIEGGPQSRIVAEPIAQEVAPVVPLTPQGFAEQIGSRVEFMRSNLLGEKAA